jgi:hypothetical protein
MPTKKEEFEPIPMFGDSHNEWWGMPEFIQHDRKAWKQLLVNFGTPEEYAEFAKLVKQPLTPKTDSIWYPAVEDLKLVGFKRYTAGGKIPRYPIYIVSKGRATRCLTSKTLHFCSIPHFVVVEEQEQEIYAKNLPSSATILVLNKEYLQNYDTCDKLGDTKSKGPGAARNFAWEHSIKNGFAWHWVMDDNIRRFHRLNQNLRVPIGDGGIFVAMENFVERYENVGMAGPNYRGFVSQRDKHPPYILNTRIYSCNLIRNDLPYRWRGRYNEDTDLSLRMLKDGWVTVQFNAFLQEKLMTQAISGGNTTEFYSKEGTLPKSEMLQKLHPDVTSVVWRYDRWHHQVDYSRFKINIPHLKPGIIPSEDTNEFDMEYEEVTENGWEVASIEEAGRALE